MVRGKRGDAPPVKVTAEVTPGAWCNFQFDKPFKIGRLKSSDIFIDNSFVSRTHAEVVFENGSWSIRDLGSANGLFVEGERTPSVVVAGLTVVKLGVAGPEVKFEVEKNPPEPVVQKTRRFKDPLLARYVDHYFAKPSPTQPVGEHTMFIRQAFAHVESKRKTRLIVIVGVLVACTLAATLFAYQERRQLLQQRATAEELFYAIKTQDVDLANLDRALAGTNSQAGVEELRRFRIRRQEMENTYDKYLATLKIYNPRMTERQKLILRVARIFGECEMDAPKDFEAEINRYIEKWRSKGLKEAVVKAQKNGYTETISRELLARGLPPQFFYLALQESNFDPYAVGPLTRKGFAKGMWQFIPETAVKYSLHLGPLVDQRRTDPADDRHNYKKETIAAATYLQDLYGTDAQASGFLVMACYNWGENQVIPLTQNMPANPKDRNFWKLLSKHRDKIPQETYDYVFNIASAAVIGENPRLFGFDFDNPLVDAADKDTLAQARSAK